MNNNNIKKEEIQDILKGIKYRNQYLEDAYNYLLNEAFPNEEIEINYYDILAALYISSKKNKNKYSENIENILSNYFNKKDDNNQIPINLNEIKNIIKLVTNINLSDKDRKNILQEYIAYEYKLEKDFQDNYSLIINLDEEKNHEKLFEENHIIKSK